MKKSIYPFISFLTLFAFIQLSCKKKCSSEHYTYDVRNEVISNLPYTGFDTLTFIRTTAGDTHVFIGNGKTMAVKYTQDAADCADSYTSNNYFLTYESKTFNSPILIGYNTALESFDYYMFFQNKKFEDDLPFDAPIDLDSISILNHTYYNIRFMPDIRPNTSPYISYFTKQFGCIKIKFENGETWELLSLRN